MYWLLLQFPTVKKGRKYNKVLISFGLPWFTRSVYPVLYGSEAYANFALVAVGQRTFGGQC